MILELPEVKGIALIVVPDPEFATHVLSASFLIYIMNYLVLNLQKYLMIDM
jgi:hypothetical protein